MLLANMAVLRWRGDFRSLWLAQTVSAVGTAVTDLALPLTAVLVLQATAFEMGLLRAAANLPVLLLGLVVGVWVDRLRRRPILIVTDLGRAALLGSIPVIALAGALRMEYLWLIAFLAGGLTITFDIAVTTYLPTLVRRAELVEMNSAIQFSSSMARVLGPGLAGGLVALVAAPLVIAIDALSFVASAAYLLRIKAAEPAPSVADRRPVRREIGEGLRFLFGHPTLGPLTLSTAIGSFGGSVQATIFVLFATQELGIGPALLGLVVAAGGMAAVLGAMLAGPVARRFGPGPAIVLGSVPLSLGALLLPVAAGPPPVAAVLLALAQALSSLGMTLYSINQISIRQALTPDRLLGRVNASRRVLVFGVAPLGALVAGVLGDLIGLRSTLLLGLVGQLLAGLVAYWSPLRTLREPV